MFDSSSYTFSVLENAALNSIVATVSATDLDEGTNAIVEYSVGSLFNVPFRFNRNNPGIILVNGPLDREDTSSYTFQVIDLSALLRLPYM